MPNYILNSHLPSHLTAECVENEACSVINFRDLVNLRHLHLTIEYRFPPIDPVPLLYRTLSISALGRMLLRIPTAHLKYIDIDFLCRYERLAWVQDDWDHMATILDPLLNASESLEKATFVFDAAKKGFEDLATRLVLQVDPGRIHYGGRPWPQTIADTMRCTVASLLKVDPHK
ncbi:hypothetical protein CCMSSC00406_0008498 [Pleurotus cornucopiae]|uniref:Uncharacterized protein n=1 Tax=Pleurotus cornucopiae TaxID=5321 RepID=A0ACB7II53_PLECO|nr:hypothetical protein CCMSSC00406_0008498 [Pleurotus cornucopiae]